MSREQISPSAGAPISLATLHSLEIDPGHSGRIYEMKSGNDILGELVATPKGKTLGAVPPGALRWSEMPTGKSFTLMLTTHTVPSSPADPALYHTSGYKMVATALMPDGGWKITEGTATGYAFLLQSLLVFVQTDSTPLQFGDGATFEWEDTLQLPSAVSYALAVDIRAN